MTSVSWNGDKDISKALGLQRPTVRTIIHKWNYGELSTKTTQRAHQRLIQEVLKEPKATFKALQASLVSFKVYDSTKRKRLKPLMIERTQRLISHLPKNILMIPKIPGLTRQKWNFLEGLCPVTSVVKPWWECDAIFDGTMSSAT